MRDMKDIYMKDLSKYSEWLDEDILSIFRKNAEFLIKKHEFYNITLRHKKLNEEESFDCEVKIKTLGLDTSKVPYTLQENRVVEDAGIALGLLFTQLLIPFEFFNVLKIGEGYDYTYLSTDNNKKEKIEMTATEVPNGWKKRLNSKIRKFNTKFKCSSGYISVSGFPDKLQVYWGHKNEGTN